MYWCILRFGKCASPYSLKFSIDEVESLDKYQIGGCHPISIGDILKDGRYKIVGKLGHGGYSTIWIARDRDAATQYVAVKVCISNNTIMSQEKDITRRLHHSDDKRTSMILPILDQFVLDGLNGQHSGIVTPPARIGCLMSGGMRGTRSFGATSSPRMALAGIIVGTISSVVIPG